jgi:hypothetical protein
VAAPHPAADSERSRTCASLIALGRYLARAVAADGLVPGVARCLLAALYAAALLNGCRNDEVAALQVMVLNHRARSRGACNLLYINMLWI